MGNCREGINSEHYHVRNRDILCLRDIQANYEKYLPIIQGTKIQKSDVQIPKKVHFIWIGPKPFPKESIPNVQSWKEHNPNWELYFWTDSADRELPIPEMTLQLIDEYDFSSIQHMLDRSFNPGETSDLLRTVIIHNEGGFYADHDSECVQSFEPFLQGFSFVCGLERLHYHERIDSCVLPSNALFGSIPGHIILKKTIEEIDAIWDLIEEKFPGNNPKHTVSKVIQRTFDSFSHAILEWRDQGESIDLILPTASFFGDLTFSSKKLKQLQKEQLIFSSHKFAGAWK